MKKLLYISLGFEPNDFYDSFCKYFDCKLYTGVQDAIAFNPDYIHLHAGSLSLEDATLLKSKTNAIWTQFTGDCDLKPLEPVTRYKDLCDITLLTIAEGMKESYPDNKRLTWMPEAVVEPLKPKELNDGKIVFVGNYYSHFPNGEDRADMCRMLSKQFGDKFECYGNFHIDGVNCKGTIKYEDVAKLYNDAFLVIAQDNFTQVNHYFTQRYLLAMAVSCCVGFNAKGLGLDAMSYMGYNDLSYLRYVIDHLYTYPEKRNLIAHNGHRCVKDNFTYDKWTERYIKIIND